ncbi:MAG: DUF4391 domain-containing protein [Clostridiales bacterium]|nr:DUF4391 domain-containing protein [Clostridiales bacterium]
MINLPKSTEFNRRIPKQKFYENLSVTPMLKRIFIDWTKAIYWRNKIAATTMNLAAEDGKTQVDVMRRPFFALFRLPVILDIRLMLL